MKHSLRILFKFRLFTGITLIGLTIAISSIWFIANYVKNSHRYDGFHQNHNRIYRLTMEVIAGGNTDHYAITGKPPGNLLYNNFPGIEAYAKMTYHNSLVKVNNEVYKETGFFSANSEALIVFSFNFISGNGERDFSNPNSILLSRVLAEKYFNSIDVIGKQIIIGVNEYTIRGVFEDWPENSHLEVNALLYSEETTDYEGQDWFDLEQFNYVLLEGSIDQSELDNKLANLSNQFLDPLLEDSGIEVKFHSQSLKGLYFAPGLIDDVPKGNKMYINALTLAGILVLLIAGLNYVNLTLTQSTQRSKEIALKKILGISRKQLLLQSGIESFYMTLLVLITSTVLIFIFDNFYTEYTGFSSIDLTVNGFLIPVCLSLIFVLGLLGSSFSGIYLSFSSRLINQEGASVNLFKKILLGFQFAIASVILIVTLAMDKQIDFMKNKDLGFSKEQVMIVNLPEKEDLKSINLQFREQIKDFSATSNASLVGGGALPGEENGKDIFQVTIDGIKIEKVYNIYRIDENYFSLLDIKIALGRNFRPDRLNDQNDGVIINESLAKSLNWIKPLGKEIWYGGELREVIGVVKNFHNKSLHNAIEPIIFLFDTNYATNLLVKTGSNDVRFIKSTWNSFFPDTPFSPTYFDQFIDTMYIKENQLSQLLGFFSMISLILCCIGLFAIFSLHTLQKTKEMSVRKVFGANALNLLMSITKNYLIITLLAIGLAIPLAWSFINSWLKGFNYRIQLEPTIFIFPASLILLASFSAIAYHIIKVLKVNPINSLKYE